MKYISIILLITVFSSCVPNVSLISTIKHKNYIYNLNKQIKHLKADTLEAQKAFLLINYLRSNPNKIKEITSISLPNYKGKNKLIWNSTLQKVAEQKAKDMANKNYFSHVNKEGYGLNLLIHMEGYTLPYQYIKRKKNNYVESIGAGYESGRSLVIGLIQDFGEPTLGHRKHLLGMQGYEENVNIGIGFVRILNSQSNYLTYCCVIIAPPLSK